MTQSPTIRNNPDGTFTLTCSIELEFPIEDIFGFFSRPENLSKLTPPSMGFRLLTPQPIEMVSGVELQYRIRPLGFPMRWTSLIETWDPPHEFSDLQLKGPFLSWEHSHRFTATKTGTRIEDHVTYRVPGGALAEKLFVRKQLLDQFQYRTERMRDLFPTIT